MANNKYTKGFFFSLVMQAMVSARGVLSEIAQDKLHRVRLAIINKVVPCIRSAALVLDPPRSTDGTCAAEEALADPSNRYWLFYALLPNLYILYFFFIPSCIGIRIHPACDHPAISLWVKNKKTGR